MSSPESQSYLGVELGLRLKSVHPTATVLSVKLTCPTKVEAGSESFLSISITQHRVGGCCWTFCCTHTHTHHPHLVWCSKSIERRE